MLAISVLLANLMVIESGEIVGLELVFVSSFFGFRISYVSCEFWLISKSNTIQKIARDVAELILAMLVLGITSIYEKPL